MNAKELRIGNYVNYDNKDAIITIDDFNHIIKYDIHIINPIPITEDWLLKFGFEQQEFTYNYNIDDTLSLQVLNVKGVYFPSLVEYPEMTLVGTQIVHLKCISFVHELQNLYFALTGEELELKK